MDLFGPKAIFCGNGSEDNALGAGMIRISVPPSQLLSSALDDQAQSDIASGFQPRLLQYRLKNLARVRKSEVAVPDFTSSTHQLACTLAMCFPENSQLASEVVQLLRLQDEEAREQRFFDVNCAILEILLAAIHKREQHEVRVDEIARDVNALLLSRGEVLEYSAESIGWRLRCLNIPRHSTSAGRQVLLRRETSQSIHCLARSYALPCLEFVQSDCPDCGQMQPTSSKDLM